MKAFNQIKANIFKLFANTSRRLLYMDPNLNRNFKTTNKDNKNQKEGQSTFESIKENMPKMDMPKNVEPKSNLNYKLTQHEEGKDMPIDKLIITDHNLVKSIYEKFKNCSEKKEAEEWRNQLMYEIARHSIAEELILYPLFRDKIPNGEKFFQDCVKDQHTIKEHLYDAQNMDASSSEYRSKIDETMKILFKHIDEEENEILPALRKNVPEDQLITSGIQFLRRKFIAPTKPHTMIPEDPPTLNGILGLLIAPIDKFKELFTSYPDQDKVSEITKEAKGSAMGSDKSKSSNEAGKS